MPSQSFLNVFSLTVSQMSRVSSLGRRSRSCLIGGVEEKAAAGINNKEAKTCCRRSDKKKD